ncbi:MAG: nucleotidyl transferase AbiEii/AbiGii toxin family protein [Hyphomicrobium sp.]|nr:nucleotidyl transferase AbiEii/AbiGii toxin family protein [Hyphomicrobium sp.]
MIPNAYLQEWSAQAPWPDPRQIEQDLIICRALCDLFSAPELADSIAFRGGTAINKLLFAAPLRYSEDIDLVQTKAGPIGETIDAIRERLAWLGPLRRSQAGHSTHLIFQFTPEADTAASLKVKVEINTREHEPLHPIKTYPFAVANPWFTGNADIRSYEPEELFGTKLRALLQRRKNRDLFDMDEGLVQLGLDPARVIAAFDHYLAHEGARITRANAEERMLQKVIRDVNETTNRAIPYRLLLTKVYPLRTRVTDFAYQELARHGLPLFRTALVERSAYREMFLNGQPPTLTEREKGAGLEVLNLLAEIRVIVNEANTNDTTLKAG